MEPIRPRDLRRKLLVALFIVFVLAGVGAFYLLRPAIRSRDLLFEGSKLVVGQSTMKDVEQVGSRFGVTPNQGCTSAHCSLTVKVENASLPRWWRREGMTFAAGFVVENGVLVEKGFSLLSGVGPNRSFAETTERQHWREIPEPLFIQKQSSLEDPKWRVIVCLTPAAPPELRARYLSFNFGCFSKFGGCTDAQQQLPTVDWKE